MQLSFKTPIWLYSHPVDFRKQIDGLVMLVASDLPGTVTSGELYIFRNRAGDKIKLLWYDENGFWLCYKRLEKGRLKFPVKDNNIFELNRDELSWLLSGLDFTKQKKQTKVRAKYFL
jgi:transposase